MGIIGLSDSHLAIYGLVLVMVSLVIMTVMIALDMAIWDEAFRFVIVTLLLGLVLWTVSATLRRLGEVSDA